MAVGLPENPSHPGHSLAQTIFAPCCRLIDRRKAAHGFFKIGCLSSSFSCLSLARLRLLILFLLLMSGNIHLNPGPVFPCSMCAGSVTWRGKPVQCCTCSKWVHLWCSRLSHTKFRTLGSSHSWSCPLCCVPVSSVDNSVTSSLHSSSLYTFTVQFGPSLLIHHFRPILASKPLVPLPSTSYLLLLHPHHRLIFLAVSLHLLLSLPP